MSLPTWVRSQKIGLSYFHIVVYMLEKSITFSKLNIKYILQPAFCIHVCYIFLFITLKCVKYKHSRFHYLLFIYLNIFIQDNIFSLTVLQYGPDVK